MLECKGTNNGGTARDKALRFERLRDESIRLDGIPLLAVLGGIGWARVNDTLAPVVRDTDGRVFTISTLDTCWRSRRFRTWSGPADPCTALARVSRPARPLRSVVTTGRGAVSTASRNTSGRW